MNRWTWILAACIVCPCAMAGDGDRVIARDLGDDTAVAGGVVSQMRAVRGDLMAAGGTVEMMADVGGDALLAGGTLRVEAPVQQSLYAAGGRLTVGAPVSRNVRIAGGDLDITAAARVGGNVSAAGGEIRVLGPVAGYVSAAAGRVLINAPVAGDVEVRAAHVELGPRAAIGGRLRYASRDELVRDPAALVKGEIERVPWIPPGMKERHPAAAGWIWTLGLMLLAAVLAGVAPRAGAALEREVDEHPGASVLAGIAALVCVPFLAIVLLVTIVGAPLGLLAILAYPSLLLLGYAAAAVAGGRIALRRFSPGRQALRGWQMLAAAGVMLAIGVVARVPWAGGLVVLLVLACGVGAILLAARRWTTGAGLFPVAASAPGTRLGEPA
jgi:hypothetical protein